MIKVLVPNLPPASALQPYLEHIHEAQWGSNFGAHETELRARLQQRFRYSHRIPHVVTFSSCTSGLEIMYDLARGDLNGVITLPAWTFPATVLAAVRVGLRVYLQDVDPDSWTHPNVATLGTHVDGNFVDAAAAWSMPVQYWQTAVFSMHSTKMVPAGEGGFMVTHDKKLADAARSYTNFGIIHGSGTPSLGMGTNAKLSEYHAAVALASIERYDANVWANLMVWYEENLDSMFVKPSRYLDAYPVFGVLVPEGLTAARVGEEMKRLGIETRRWYYPAMDKHPVISKHPNVMVKEEMPVTRMLEERFLGLPWHAHLKEADVVTVCATLKNVCSMPSRKALR